MGALSDKKLNGQNLRRETFVREYVVDFNASRAMRAAGYSESAARSEGCRFLQEPEIQNRIREVIAEQHGEIKSRRFDVIAKVREVVDRCMQAAPVTDRTGKALDGEWTFDANAALRGLELLGKHEGLFNKVELSVTEDDARRVIKYALKVVSTKVSPEVFREIVTELEAIGAAEDTGDA